MGPRAKTAWPSRSKKPGPWPAPQPIAVLSVSHLFEFTPKTHRLPGTLRQGGRSSVAAGGPPAPTTAPSSR
eukprot:5105595-Pyramimonas_sp.AAC.1